MAEVVEEAGAAADEELPAREDGTMYTHYKGAQPPVVELVLIVESQAIWLEIVQNRKLVGPAINLDIKQVNVVPAGEPVMDAGVAAVAGEAEVVAVPEEDKSDVSMMLLVPNRKRKETSLHKIPLKKTK